MYSQFPVPSYPSGHASADPRVLGPIPPQLGTGHFNDLTRRPPAAFPHPFPDAFPDARAPDRAHPPPYPVGGFRLPGVPEPLYPIPSYGGGSSHGSVSSHASETGRHCAQVRQPDYNLSPNNHASRNPPTWPSPTRTLSSFAYHRIISLTRSFTSSAATTTTTTTTAG